MAKFNPAMLDGEILKALSGRSDGAATYVLRNILDWPGEPFHRQWLGTSHVLTACRRLERKGLAEEVPSIYAVMKKWRITDLGRQALTGNGRGA